MENEKKQDACCTEHGSCGCTDNNENEAEKHQLLQSKYTEYQALEQQLKQIQQHMQKMDEQIGEVMTVMHSLEELNNKAAESEILVPLSNGIFFKAKKGDSDKFLVNVGAGVVVEKGFKGTKELIDSRAVEIGKYREQLAEEMMKLAEKYQDIEKELETLIH